MNNLKWIFDWQSDNKNVSDISRDATRIFSILASDSNNNERFEIIYV